MLTGMESMISSDLLYIWCNIHVCVCSLREYNWLVGILAVFYSLGQLRMNVKVALLC